MLFGLRDAGTVSNKLCMAVSLEACYWSYNAYLIHTSNEGIIGRGIVLHRDKNTITLCWSNINQICFGSLGVDAINFRDPHGVAFEPEVLSGKSAHVDDTEHISLSRLDWRCEVVGVIHEGGLRYRLSPRWVGHTDETLHQRRYLVVIPV